MTDGFPFQKTINAKKIPYNDVIKVPPGTGEMYDENVPLKFENGLVISTHTL